MWLIVSIQAVVQVVISEFEMPASVWSVLEGRLVGGKVSGERYTISRHFLDSCGPGNWNKLQKETIECITAKHDNIEGPASGTCKSLPSHDCQILSHSLWAK